MDWAGCRDQWEAGLSAHKLCKLYPISRQAIDQRAKSEGWVKHDRIVNTLPAVTGFYELIASTTATPEAIALILKSYEDGNSQNVVAAMAGFSHTTLANWRRDHAEFDKAVRKAQAKHASSLINNIKRASDRDWRAADRLLQVNELTKAEHQPSGADQGKPAINVVININRPAIEGDRVIEHEP